MSARGTSRVSVRPTSFCASARDPHGSLAWQWARVHRAAPNPMTILSFVAVFAGFGLGSSPDYLDAARKPIIRVHHLRVRDLLTLAIVVRMSPEMTPDKSLQANVGWRLH